MTLRSKVEMGQFPLGQWLSDNPTEKKSCYVIRPWWGVTIVLGRGKTVSGLKYKTQGFIKTHVARAHGLLKMICGNADIKHRTR